MEMNGKKFPTKFNQIRQGSGHMEYITVQSVEDERIIETAGIQIASEATGMPAVFKLND